MCLNHLEYRASYALRTPIQVAVCRSDRDDAILNVAERAQLARFQTDERRRDWRRGRLALKSVLQSMGRSDDTSAIRFPHAQLSLSHGDGTAIAVGTNSQSARVGVDFEAVRPVNERVARWFLNDAESEWLAQCAPAKRTESLIRLWTVKEAVFKCHPNNRGLVMTDFTIADPSSYRCEVRCADGRRFRCASFPEEAGFISIAVLGEGNED